MGEANNSKRIARNTIYLYVRMLVVLLVKLYTSRVILQSLGAVDFGIYNLVAGVIVLFSFLNYSMDGASQRFFNWAMGKRDEKLLRNYFINSVNAHLIIAGVTVVFAETIGLFWLYNYTNIPAERFGTAQFVFQISVLTSVFTIVRTPYNAIVIAYERMSFYAYVGVVEVLLNLGMAMALSYLSFDKLAAYSVFMMLIPLITLLVYIYYCSFHYPVSRYRFTASRATIVEIMSFSLWSTLSSFANLCSRQCLNIILNLFCGVVINAATAIMTQVSSAVYSFVQNFQLAINPQLTKSYAAEDWTYLNKLFNSASRISFYLMLLLSMPVVLCMDEVLEIWLGEVPAYTGIFCILSIVALLVNSLVSPVRTVIQASGKIKLYQITMFVITMLNIPLYYISLRIGWSVYVTLIWPIIAYFAIMTIGLYIIRRNNSAFSLREYCQAVAIPIMEVSVISVILPIISAIYLRPLLPELAFIVSVIVVSFISVFSCIYLFGISAEEKGMIKYFVRHKLLRR